MIVRISDGEMNRSLTRKSVKLEVGKLPMNHPRFCTKKYFDYLSSRTNAAVMTRRPPTASGAVPVVIVADRQLREVGPQLSQRSAAGLSLSQPVFFQ